MSRSQCRSKWIVTPRLLPWVGLLVLVSACRDSPHAEEGSVPPNILWVVWDTVRADRLSLHGHAKPTTPFLEEWSQGARVFDNCISTASSTVPSHAAMFTSKLPSEHGARFGHPWLDDHHKTIAELLRKAGYQTYLWSANPHISSDENFQQGFEVEEHPWDHDTAQEAYRITVKKLQGDHSSELAERLQGGKPDPWAIKATGELAERGLRQWLEQRDPQRPFFAFLNYMEAHRPFLPPHQYREQMMSPAQVRRSYHVDRSWVPMWSYTFGLREYTDEELEIMAATYDATLAELDDLFRSLVTFLEARGNLENTAVVLTGDHGEHLGEHHMLDHQFSLYNGLVRVPLILYYPPRVVAGRDPRPVVNFDIFPTLLDLAGVAAPPNLRSSAVSLLHPRETRSRLAELLAVFSVPFPAVREKYPDLDTTPFERRLRALFREPYKLIWAEDSHHELYHLADDPDEETNLMEHDREAAGRMLLELGKLVETLDIAGLESLPVPEPSPEHLERLRQLGYLAGSPSEEEK